MVALSKTLAALPPNGFRVEFGTAYWDGTEWWANVRGSLLMARWMDPIQPQQGGKIVVAIMTDGMGLSTALVLGAYTDQPRPSTGSVLTVGVMTAALTQLNGSSAQSRVTRPGTR